ncbi:MAG TPA: ferritin-like domain-containing protein [Nitrosomonas sp.]|nr:ferritin-like domain-containing protein [Nitrosomonas sp.]
MKTSLFDIAASCLIANEIEEKLLLTQQATQAWRNKLLSLDSHEPTRLINQPGQPAKLVLVKPSDVPRRRLGNKVGLIALIHAIAHIEFNAINLAWDAIHRFRGLPDSFYDDWVTVASEEAYHFQLLHKRLKELDHDYGDLPAHNGLWDMALLTASDPLIRMALVPRVLEARGLDVTPGIIKRLRQIGDEKTIEILEIILRDEIGHVSIGSRWYNFFCNQRQIDPEKKFSELVNQYFCGQITGPFHYEARQKAGFTLNELSMLEGMEIPISRSNNYNF